MTTVRAAAKINLHLGVGPIRPDGFHELSTVYQAIGLYDDVSVQSSHHWSVQVEPIGRVEVDGVPLDESNLALRAARLLLDHHGHDGAIEIQIEKGIPMAGGLAGGSADAAATLVGVDRLLDLRTTDDDLLALAAELGSDVPFALLGGTAYGTGHGEVVEPVVDNGSYWWVVVLNDIGLSTPAVYRGYDDGPPGSTERPVDLLVALEAGDAQALGLALRNDLQAAALGLRADLSPTVDRLQQSSALGVLLSGSGPTCLALARDAEHARRLAGELLEDGYDHVLVAPAPVAGAHVVGH